MVCLVWVFVVSMSGCDCEVSHPSISGETKVTTRIEQLCQAISNQNWSLARSYCYPESSAYLTVDQYKDLIESYPPGTTFEIDPAIQSVHIIDNEATVELSPSVQVCYQGDCLLEAMDHPGTTTLVESEGEWYLYY